MPDELTRRDRPLEGEWLGPETPHERAARERLNFLAWLFDSSIPLPGTRFTICSCAWPSTSPTTAWWG